MTPDEIRAKIAEHTVVQTNLRNDFKAEVAGWTGGGASDAAVRLWTDILRVTDLIIELQLQLPDDGK